MLSFVSLHLGTMVVGLLVLAAAWGAVVHLIRNRRKGKCMGCDCGCGGCSHSSDCQSE